MKVANILKSFLKTNNACSLPSPEPRPAHGSWFTAGECKWDFFPSVVVLFLEFS